MTDPEMNDISPEAMAEIMNRLEVRPGEPMDTELAADTEADNRTGLRPRSVKMSDDLDLRCGIRASELGLSKSAYVRRLIEADLHAAYSMSQKWSRSRKPAWQRDEPSTTRSKSCRTGPATPPDQLSRSTPRRPIRCPPRPGASAPATA
ncbi:hypothetical protein ACFV4K_31445 [Nocardia sp. NPDC059764]|uniref:hypothetical protein n=1 Tax=Nocardia sp. NPDC059764 TaxID=3346939 RepID=UPI00364A7145